MNPCPCGYFGDKEKQCSCSPMQTQNYRKKISGPILDRIDIHIEVPRVNFEKLSAESGGEDSESIKVRVESAREKQNDRFKNEPILTNSEMSSETVKRFCRIDGESQELLKMAVNRMHLSARAYFRVLKLARTIADLEAMDEIKSMHIAEALQYRPKMEV
jgi:magnesium chelatase family protein